MFAANGGTVSVSAGFDPTMSPALTAYFAACGVACDITVNGTIWGDQAGASPLLASLVRFDAASSIDEQPAAAKIGATTLTGTALDHANLSETVAGTLATGAPLNQIGTLAGFVTNLGNDDAQGFFLRDGRSLTVSGPVSDGGPTASRGISIAVAPGTGTIYTPGDLTLGTSVSAATTVRLQATGTVSEAGGGAIQANTLVLQTGVVPDTEATGNTPGQIPAPAATIGTAAATLNGANAIANLGSAAAGVTTTGNFSLTNGVGLTVGGNVVSTTGTVFIGNTGNVTNNAVIRSVVSDVGITASGDIANNDLISAGGTASLNAFGSINDAAGGVITADGLGSTAAATVSLVAQTGTIGEAAGGTIEATAPTGNVQLTTESTSAGDIFVGGVITASGSAGVVGLTAGGSITQSSGTILAGGPGAIAVSGSVTPDLTLLAQNGTIGQAAGALIAAPNAAGVIGLRASGDIRFAGTVAGVSGVSMVSGGTIGEASGSGLLQAGTLVGSAANGATLIAGSGSGNQVAILGSFVTGSGGAGDFVLTMARA